MKIPAYKRISMTFQIGKQKYYGMGIASPAALYLVMTQQRSLLVDGLAGGLGGAVGGLIAGAIAAAGTRKAQAVQTCTIAQLHPSIRDHPQFPYKVMPKGDGPQILVIPRNAVEIIEHPSFTNLLKFEIGDTPVTIEYLLFRGTSIRDYLVQVGWPVTWRGRVLSEAGG